MGQAHEKIYERPDSLEAKVKELAELYHCQLCGEWVIKGTNHVCKSWTGISYIKSEGGENVEGKKRGRPKGSKNKPKEAI